MGSLQTGSSVCLDLDPGTGVRVLGLPPGMVRLREYTPLWAELFEIEAAQIRAVLGDLALGVEHVGSTAVPGLRAKPILDIAVAVRTRDLLSLYAAHLAELGYEHASHIELENDFVFEKGIDRTHHLHLVELESREWRDYLRFRNTLRANEPLAREYERIKIELGVRFHGNRRCYTSAKTLFIRHVLSSA